MVKNKHFPAPGAFRRYVTTIYLTSELDLPPPAVIIYTATFFSPVAGVVYFRHVGGTNEVIIFGRLSRVDVQPDPYAFRPTVAHNWGIHVNGVSGECGVVSVVGGGCRMW